MVTHVVARRALLAFLVAVLYGAAPSYTGRCTAQQGHGQLGVQGEARQFELPSHAPLTSSLRQSVEYSTDALSHQGRAQAPHLWPRTAMKDGDHCRWGEATCHERAAAARYGASGHAGAVDSLLLRAPGLLGLEPLSVLRWCWFFLDPGAHRPGRDLLKLHCCRLLLDLRAYRPGRDLLALHCRFFLYLRALRHSVRHTVKLLPMRQPARQGHLRLDGSIHVRRTTGLHSSPLEA